MTTAAGCVAAHAEKYSHLVPNYIIACGLSFLRALGSRPAQESGEANSTTYFLQSLSIVVQQGNAMAILGCASSSH